jgi:DNA-binding CsgD family transcriptional regulator
VVTTFVAISAAEDSRVDGPPDAGAWAEVARLWDVHHQPYPGAYALLHQAEAEFMVRARSAAGTDALRRAEKAASEMGARPLLDEIRELAEHARVALYEPALEAPPTGSAVPPLGRPAGHDPLDGLTARELEVLTVLAAGLTNREIAGRLFIAEKTVGIHLGRIYHKLGVRGRVQATSLLHVARPDLRHDARR